MGALRAAVTWTPMAVLIAVHSLAVASGYRARVLAPLLLVAGIVLSLALLAAAALRIRHPFTWSIGAVAMGGIGAALLAPATVGELFLRHAIPSLYLALLLAASVPQLLGRTPFSVEFARGRWPDAIVESEQFRRVNARMSWIWAGLFVVAGLLAIVPWSEDSGLQVVVAGALPAALLLLVGVPLNRFGPGWLMQRTPASRTRFPTLAALFEAMPMGLNRRAAEGVELLVQFRLTGDEPIEGYLEVRDGAARFTQGAHPEPATVVRADSSLWLQISNGEVSGDRAWLEKRYEAEGDLTALLQLDRLFSPPPATRSPRPAPPPFRYGTLGRRLPRVVVFDGGPRGRRFSKSSMMARQFCRGAEAEGAQVEYVELRKRRIRDCTGCYGCWTAHPGDCVFDGRDDDMAGLRRLYREADLVVLVTPLYIFGPTGLLKTFLDRTLPNLRPYMLRDEFGRTRHPHRFPGDPEQGLVVFSAGGFPDVDHNFDGLRGMVRCMDSHYEKQRLLGEFYLPGAEMLAQPVYADRLRRVQASCLEAGRQAVRTGSIEARLMEVVADPEVSPEVFGEQADAFWETLDGKQAFLKAAPRLPA